MVSVAISMARCPAPILACDDVMDDAGSGATASSVTRQRWMTSEIEDVTSVMWRPRAGKRRHVHVGGINI